MQQQLAVRLAAAPRAEPQVLVQVLAWPQVAPLPVALRAFPSLACEVQLAFRELAFRELPSNCR